MIPPRREILRIPPRCPDEEDPIVRIAKTACGHRWQDDRRDNPWEREAPTTPFGRMFADLCIRMVGPMIERTGRTFMHGGCAMLADAVAIWSNGLLVPHAIRYHGYVDHVVASDGRILLDSDGLFDVEGFARKCFVLDEDRDVAFDPRPWTGGDPIGRDAATSAWLAEEMEDFLPSADGKPWEEDASNRQEGNPS